MCAAALTAFSIFLGSFLKEKAELAESILDTTSTPTESAQTAPLFPDGVESTSDAKDIKVCASFIDILSETPAEIKGKINSLSEKYNSVSVNIVSENGQLVYLSQALLDYVRLDPTSVTAKYLSRSLGDDSDTDEEVKIDVLDNIEALLASAKENGVRTSAMFSTSSAVLTMDASGYAACEIDSIILGELSDFGFDEVIISGLITEDSGITNDILKNIVSYLAVLRKNSGDLDIGVVLPESIYLTPQSAASIKTLADYVDFLAVTVNNDAVDPYEVYSSIYDNYHSLKGNFSVYNIRAVITSNDPDVACAIYASLNDLCSASVQFSIFVEDPDFSAETPSDTTEDTETDVISNDNANREDSYINETEDLFATEQSVPSESTEPVDDASSGNDE